MNITAKDALDIYNTACEIDVSVIRDEINWNIDSVARNAQRRCLYFKQLTEKMESALIASLENDGFSIKIVDKDYNDPIGKRYIEISW